MGSENGVDRMDKNKSRTDLLAAGRKKVLVFCCHLLLFFDYKCLVDEKLL